MKTSTIIIISTLILILAFVGFTFLRFEPDSRTVVIRETPILKPEQVPVPQSIPSLLPPTSDLTQSEEPQQLQYSYDLNSRSMSYGQTNANMATVDRSIIASSTEPAPTGSGPVSQSKYLKSGVAPVKIEDGSVTLPPVEKISHSDFQSDKKVIVIVDKKNTQTYLLQKQDGGIFIVYECDNAIGTSDSPTPPGPYKIASKTTQPTWIPPKSIDPKQEEIGPFDQNKNNPLGVAAVRLNKWNIVLHGTNNPDSIGRRVSHGCIRHRNDDIMRIYKAVDTGNTVIVTDTLEGTKIDTSMLGKQDAS